MSDINVKNIDFTQMWQQLKLNWKKIAIPTGIVTLIAILYCIFATPIFTATVIINPPKLSDAGTRVNQALSGFSDAVTGGGFLAKTDTDIATSILGTNRVRDMVVKKFNLQQYYNKKDIELTRRALKGSVTITPDAKAGFLAISVDDKDPKLAADIANYYIMALGQAISQVAIDKSQARSSFYEAEMEQAKAQLDIAESNLKQFIQANGIIAGQQASVIAGITTQLQAQLTVYQSQLEAMKLYASEDNPDYQLLKSQINAIKTQLSRISGQPGTADNITIPANLAPDLAQKYVDLTRVRLIREAVYKVLVNQYESYKYDSLIEQSPTPIQVIDPAQIPLYKSRPKRLQIVILSFILSLFISSIYILFKRRKLIIN